MYKHYIRLNEAGVIIHGFSSAFEQPQAGDILVAEEAPRHFHQSWPPLTNERGQFLFKWSNGRVDRTQTELDAEWSQRPPDPPTLEEQIAYLKQRDKQMQEDNSAVLEALILAGLIE